MSSAESRGSHRYSRGSTPQVPAAPDPVERAVAPTPLPSSLGTVLTDHALDEPARLAALRLAGASPAADATFDRYTRLVCRLVEVPVALVSLVDDERQCLVGATGLPDEVDRRRQTPLSHSFCQYVVRSRTPLIVADALADSVLHDNGAVADLGVVAYAGIPLTTESGEILGSLAAIDSQARDWKASELEILQELAAACSTELRLRAETRRLELERDTSERLRGELAIRNTRLTVTARLGAALARTLDFAAVARIVSDHLAAACGGWAAIVATDDDGLEAAFEVGHGVVPDDPVTATSWLERFPCEQMLTVLAATDDRLPAAQLRAMGVERVVIARIAGRATQGRIAVGVACPAGATTDVQQLVAEVSVMAALALDNSALVARHRRTAETLQRHMLIEVPDFPGTALAATYQAATDDAAVGGDWYDAFDHPDGWYWLVIGDVMGHDLHAAGMMARLQHYVRAIALDGDRAPREVLERVDRLLQHHDTEVYATCVVMRLRPGADASQPRTWELEWSNAGHLPPVLSRQGDVQVLVTPADLLLGAATPARRDHVRTIAAGSRLVLFTDGLVEQRNRTVDEGMHRLCAAIAHGADAAPIEVCTALVTSLVDGCREDDVAVMVLELELLPSAGDAGSSSTVPM